MLTLGTHSCLLHTPSFTTGPVSCPTRHIEAETPLCSVAISSNRSAMYLDSPYPIAAGMDMSWNARSGTFSLGCLMGQLVRVEMLDVKRIGGLLGDALDISIMSRTPAMCGSKDSRLRLKSTCHWLSLHFGLAKAWITDGKVN